jgi:hypothetical protein
MRFLDGLKDHIRIPVSMQRPQNWDTACVLALLQEDLTSSRKSEVRKWDVSSGARPFARSALHPLPPRIDKPGALPETRVYTDPGRSLSANERWAALRSSRRAQGLCIRCGVKWSKDHRCAQAVQLNALEEVLALFSVDDSVDAMEVDQPPEHAEVQMLLSMAAVSGISTPRTMTFDGFLGDTPVRILLDSGSTHTFISTAMAATCLNVQALYPPVHVKVANGQVLTCSQFIPSAEWSVQGFTFHSDLKVLPLPSYDMILGVDWLSSHSPMKVHWSQHWLQIPHQQGIVQLQGTWSSLPAGAILQLCSPEVVASDPSPEAPPEVQKLLQDFATLFEPPTQLPPSRNCDHAIPLQPGVAPVFSRPYRFAPAIKDEIEKQVKEMLEAGLIQKSSSPFSSLVLLVKKKDQTWRFCVDYHQLNSITLKSKYPVTIIDELLDELGHATWFSKLDLRSGFHQILLRPGEVFKTAFQTHFWLV